MRSRFSILSLGVSLLGLPVALAQVPPPLPLAKPAPAAPQIYTPVAPQPLKLVPPTPQGTLTGVPVMPPANTFPMPAPSGTSVLLPLPPQGTAVQNLPGLTWTYAGSTAPVKPQTKVFEVADLVASPVQIPGAAAMGHGQATNAHLLMKLIVAMTKPESWERGGGKGKIEYIAQSECLCATNSPEVLTEVKKLLDGLRRMQDQQVVLEVQLVKVPSGFGAKAGWPTEKGSKCLKPAEAKKALETLKDDKHAEIITQPKLTLIDGQVGFFQVGQQVPFTQFTDLGTKGSEKVVQSNVQFVFCGSSLRCTPTISMDGQSISLKMHTSQTNLGRAVPAPNSPSASPIDKLECETTLVIPTGNTAISFLGEVDADQVLETNLFPKVPYLNRLVKNRKTEKVKAEYYQIVTARILKPGEEAAPVKPACCTEATSVTKCPPASPIVGVQLAAPAPIQPVVPPGLFSFYTGWTR